METTESPSCLHCGIKLEVPATGRTPKFCSIAHRSAFARRLKGTPAREKSPEEPPLEPVPEQPPSIYDDPWATLPPEIAAYLPSREERYQWSTMFARAAIKPE